MLNKCSSSMNVPLSTHLHVVCHVLPVFSCLFPQIPETKMQNGGWQRQTAQSLILQHCSTEHGKIHKLLRRRMRGFRSWSVLCHNQRWRFSGGTLTYSLHILAWNGSHTFMVISDDAEHSDQTGGGKAEPASFSSR